MAMADWRTYLQLERDRDWSHGIQPMGEFSGWFHNLPGQKSSLGVGMCRAAPALWRSHSSFVSADDFGGCARLADGTGIHPYRSVAQPANLIQLVADQNHRTPGPRNIPHLAQTLLLKLEIAHCQHLVHQQNLRLQMRGDCKCQPYIHAAGIMFYRGINKFFQLRETHNFVEFADDLLLAHSQNRAAQKGVLPASEFGMKTGANFQEAANAAVNFRPALGRPGDTGKDLQQGGLAGPVAPDQAQNFALAYVKRNVFQRPECFRLIALKGGPGRAQHTRQSVTQQAGGGQRATLVALAEPFGMDDGGAHTRSAMLPSMRLKNKRPPKTATPTMPTEAKRLAAGGWPVPVSAQRKPSITPAIGFRP